MMTDEQRELLEAEYLRRLMKADAKVRRARILGWDCGSEQASLDLPPEQRRAIRLMRLVRHQKREDG